MTRIKTKKIYIVLTYTGTILSKVIRLYTKAEYCHVSLALDENLSEMYSFGRSNPYNPFNGGFVHESINYGTFKRFKNTKAEVYSLSLTNKQYKKIKSLIRKMNQKRDLYKFNIIGLFGVGFNLKYQKENAFYCAEFVKYLIDKANIKMELPELVKPIDFKKVDSLELLYQGMLNNYNV